MTKEEKQKCLNCINCDIDGTCIAKREALFDSFICEHNEQFEPLGTGEIEVNDEKKKESTFCTWTNRGSKISPALFTAGCNGQNINVVKMMRKKGQFIDKCPFCGLTVNWQGHKK